MQYDRKWRESESHFIKSWNGWLPTTLCGITPTPPSKRYNSDPGVTIGGDPTEVHCRKCQAVAGVRQKLKAYRVYLAIPIGDEKPK